MSKLMDKLSDKLANLGKSDKSDKSAHEQQQEPLKVDEAGKKPGSPPATQIEDTGESVLPEDPQTETTKTAEPSAPATDTEGTKSSTLTEPAPERSTVTSGHTAESAQPQEAAAEQPAKPSEPEQPATLEGAGLGQKPEPELLEYSEAEQVAAKNAEPEQAQNTTADDSQSAQPDQPATLASAGLAEQPEPQLLESSVAEQEAAKSKEPEQAQSAAADSSAQAQPEDFATLASAGLAQQPEPNLLESQEAAQTSEAGQPQTTAQEKVEDTTNKTSQTDDSEVYVGSIDQGTTSTRFLIFNKSGEPVAVHQEEFEQIYPNPGYVKIVICSRDITADRQSLGCTNMTQKVSSGLWRTV